MTAQTSHLRKTFPAFAIALGMTFFLAICILAFGVNALLNRNTVPVQAANASASAPAAQADPASVQQLQSTIATYQSREAQYQTQLQQAADQINQLTQQNQQYQSLINYLQNVGVIRIGTDGRVYLNRNVGDGGG